MRERLSLSLDQDVIEAVKKAAAREGRSASRMIEIILKQHIKKIEEQKRK